MKRLVLMAVVLVMSGCTAPALKVVDSGNTGLTIEAIGYVDGATVYRLRDGGRPIYFVLRGKAEGMAMYTESCGKNCTATKLVQTIESK